MEKGMVNMLRMNTESVSNMALQLTIVSEEITNQGLILLDNFQQLDWVATGRDQFLEEFRQLITILSNLSDEGMIISNRLKSEVHQWELLSQGIPITNQIIAGGDSFSSFSEYLKNAGTENNIGLLKYSFPAVWGVFTLATNLFTDMPSWVKSFFQGTGMESNGNKQFNSGLSANLNISKTDSTNKSGFGLLLEKINQEDSMQPDKVSVSKLGEIMNKEEADWWIDVPIKSQIGLKYKDSSTGYGCVPTSASMVLEYWHQQDEKHVTLSPQDIVNINIEQHDFSAKGMSINKLGSELENIGYSFNTIYEGNSGDVSVIEALKNAVKEGPVVANVRTGLSTTGYPHAVVVTGISADNQVRINDPLTGKSSVYTWEEFDRSWGSDFGEGVATRIFSTIMPRNE